MPVTVNEASVDVRVDARLEDTETDAQSGVAAAERLVEAGYPYVTGCAASGITLPVSQEVFVPNEVVGCSPSSTVATLSNIDDADFVFRTAPSDHLQAQAMAEIATTELSAESASILHVNNRYGEQLSQTFATAFERAHGGTVWRRIGFQQGATSYSAVLEDPMKEAD